MKTEYDADAAFLYPYTGEQERRFRVVAYKYAVVVAEALIEGAVPQAAADDSAVNPPSLQVAHDLCGVAVRLRQLKRLWRGKICQLGRRLNFCVLL